MRKESRIRIDVVTLGIALVFIIMAHPQPHAMAQQSASPQDSSKASGLREWKAGGKGCSMLVGQNSGSPLTLLNHRMEL